MLNVNMWLMLEHIHHPVVYFMLCSVNHLLKLHKLCKSAAHFIIVTVLNAVYGLVKQTAWLVFMFICVIRNIILVIL